MKRNAFTMIELVFVIVVIGILSAIAIPKFAATRDDAQIAKGRSDVAAIRASIVSERQGRLLQGSTAYINQLDDAANATAGETLFDNNGTAANSLLQYGVTSANGNGHWMKTGANAYTYQVMGDPVAFTYYPTVNGTHPAGTFDCTHTNVNCKHLTE
jgi:general secretion pathway protein G